MIVIPFLSETLYSSSETHRTRSTNCFSRIEIRNDKRKYCKANERETGQFVAHRGGELCRSVGTVRGLGGGGVEGGGGADVGRDLGEGVAFSLV